MGPRVAVLERPGRVVTSRHLMTRCVDVGLIGSYSSDSSGAWWSREARGTLPFGPTRRFDGPEEFDATVLASQEIPMRLTLTPFAAHLLIAACGSEPATGPSGASTAPEVTVSPSIGELVAPWPAARASPPQSRVAPPRASSGRSRRALAGGSVTPSGGYTRPVGHGAVPRRRHLRGGPHEERRPPPSRWSRPRR